MLWRIDARNIGPICEMPPAMKMCDGCEEIDDGCQHLANQLAGELDDRVRRHVTAPARLSRRLPA